MSRFFASWLVEPCDGKIRARKGFTESSGRRLRGRCSPAGGRGRPRSRRRPPDPSSNRADTLRLSPCGSRNSPVRFLPLEPKLADLRCRRSPGPHRPFDKTGTRNGAWDMNLHVWGGPPDNIARSGPRPGGAPRGAHQRRRSGYSIPKRGTTKTPGPSVFHWAVMGATSGSRIENENRQRGPVQKVFGIERCRRPVFERVIRFPSLCSFGFGGPGHFSRRTRLAWGRAGSLSRAAEPRPGAPILPSWPGPRGRTVTAPRGAPARFFRGRPLTGTERTGRIPPGGFFSTDGPVDDRRSPDSLDFAASSTVPGQGDSPLFDGRGAPVRGGRFQALAIRGPFREVRSRPGP